MSPEKVSFSRFDLYWLLFVGVCTSAWSVSASLHLGATFDEPFYVAKGLESWRHGSNRALMRAGTMPLPVDVQTLPLYLWERFRGHPFDPVSDLEILLPIARGMNLLFWWMLLLYSGSLAMWWGGPFASRLVIGMVGCEPSLLAHASLATTDIGVTAMLLAAIYHFAIGRNELWRKRVLIPGVLAGFAVASKASAITFLPMAFLAVSFPRSRQSRLDFIQIACVAGVVLFTYCGSDWAQEPSFIRWANHQPDSLMADVLRFAAEHLRIFPNAGEGIVQQIKHNLRGHGSYVLGEWHPRAVWYYFPIVLSGKLTEPVLVTLVGLVLFRPRSLFNPAGLIALVYVLFSLTCRVQIGVRLLFPLVVMIQIAMGVALLGRQVDGPSTPYRRLGAAVVVMIASALVAVFSWPDGLRYLNQFWGGSSRAGTVMTDSNHDWGQGLPELAKWHDENGRPHLTVWYYGTDPAILLPPFHIYQVNQLDKPSIDAVRRKVGGGHFAVGMSLLTACPDRRPETLSILDWLKSLKPVASVGTFLVYRFD